MSQNKPLLRLALTLALLCSLVLPAARPLFAQDEPQGEALNALSAPESVSFPGSYANRLGGTDWEPADPTVQAADAEGDGIWTLAAALPGGDYEFKVAVNGTWDENYGRNGVQGGENISFTVPAEGGDVSFSYNRNSGEIGVQIAPPTQVEEPPAARGDGQFVRSAILHDSRSDRYRTPFGAQPVNTDVTLRLRTAANDVESVTLVTNNLGDGSGSSHAMTKVVSDGQFDWWQTTLNTGPDVTVHNYYFALTDGAAAYYADDPMLNGGTGQFATAAPGADGGWDIYTYAAGFDAPAWAKNATIYQIFPDRFRNGEPANDPTAADWFYPDERGHAFPVTPWNRPVPDPVPLDPAQNPEWYNTFSSTFYGGDLQGVQEKLDYLQELGVTTIYFNPIFDSPSNHRYDGRDYRQVAENLAVAGDPKASNELFRQLAAEMQKRGMHLILDGVPNHTSSDSPFFDRFARHDLEGACESETSPYREWYIFTPARPAGTGVCAGDTNYAAWASVATLPQVNTADEAVIDNWLGPDGIATTWLQTPGVDGWRIDVVPDVVNVNPAFFELMRKAAKAANPEALLISETWPENQARLRVLGDEFDSTMNYRFRMALLGFLRDSDYADNDPQIPALSAGEFDAALRGIQEDYPPAAFATAMNLISSHDVNRAVNVLDKDGVNAERTAPVNDFVDGRHRLALAAALQFTLPGAPTIYYGDEVGLAGFGSDPQRDDPYNRQPYPWSDAPGYSDLPAWRQADTDLLALYQQLGQLRSAHSFLRTGTWDTLAVDDDSGLYAYGRKDDSGAAIAVFNRGSSPITASLDLGGYLPSNAALTLAPLSAVPGGAEGEAVTLGEDGSVQVVVPPLDFRILLTGADADMQTPNPPTVTATEGNRELTLAPAVSATETATVTEFVILRSLVNGGFTEIGRMPNEADALFADPDVANGTTYYYQVQAVGEHGLLSAPASTGPLIPHAPILSIVIDEPLVLHHNLSAIERSPQSTAAVMAPGITEIAGAGAGLRAEIGWAPAGTEEFTWADGAYVTDNQGGANVYGGTMLPETAGDYDFAWRATTTGGRDWTLSENRGKLTVYPAADAEAPKPPFRLDPVARSGSQVSFAWRVSRPPDLYNFRICRADLTGGESGCATRFDVPKESGVYTDTAVTAGSTYTYTVQSVDTSFNVSEPSAPLTLTAELSMVDVTWRVRVPSATPPDDLIFIAGDNADAFGASYNPGLQQMTPVGDNLWEYTAKVQEGTRLQYKYTRGAWESVEQWGTISGMNNRQLQIVNGPDNTMLVDDTATDWDAEGSDDRRGVQTWRDPLVAVVEPPANSTGPVTTVRVEFATLVSAGAPEQVLAVTDAAGSPVTGTVTQEGGRAFVFTPNQPLAPGEYRATAANVATDTPMLAPYQWQFTMSK